MSQATTGTSLTSSKTSNASKKIDVLHVGRNERRGQRPIPARASPRRDSGTTNNESYPRTAIATVVVLFAGLQSSDAAAGLPRPYNWAKLTPDGKCVVIMNANADVAVTSPLAGLSLEEFPTSGLYMADPPHDMIWTFPPGTWFAKTEMMSASGHYIVSPGGWALSISHAPSTVATVYRNGRPLHVIDVNDVISLPRLKSLLNAGPVECVEHRFDPDVLTLAYVTDLGESTTVDIRTGKTLLHNAPLVVSAMIGIAVCGVVVLMIVYTIICRVRNIAIAKVDPIAH